MYIPSLSMISTFRMYGSSRFPLSQDEPIGSTKVTVNDSPPSTVLSTLAVILTDSVEVAIPEVNERLPLLGVIVMSLLALEM